MSIKLKRILLLMFFDIILINLVYIIAFSIRFEGVAFLSLGNGHQFFAVYLKYAIFITAIKITIFFGLGLYNSLWRYASVEELIQIVLNALFANTAVVTFLFILQMSLPRSINILVFMLDVILVGSLRFSYRLLRSFKNSGLDILTPSSVKRILIVGAGQAGAMVIKELKNHEELNGRPVAVVDDDEFKLGKKINGVPVMGNRKDIRRVIERKKIDEIIIAIPSANRNEIKEIVEECSKTKCKLKIVPGMYELINGQVSIKNIRDVDIEDLLGRDPINVDLEEIAHYLSSKVVLVTGGGGSIGSELCRQISQFKPMKLIILDIYENNAYEIQNELKEKYANLNLSVLIASVRDRQRIKEIFEQYKPNVVFHAAAHKHVPLMEENPEEALKNNVFGTLNVAEMADAYGADKFVLISTDKAVNPTNIMGATKRIAEMIIQSLSKISKTEFVAVRFGNVLESNGSVIPLFKKQIHKGGPVTVTHPDVTRFFMTISEAVQLVIQAGAMAIGGEVFVLDMGQPVKIMDLAENLIRLSGFEPNKDIDIQIIGLRPGEKLFEELLMDEEGLEKTKNKKIYIGKPSYVDYKVLKAELNHLYKIISSDKDDLWEYVEHMVPTYQRTS